MKEDGTDVLFLVRTKLFRTVPQPKFAVRDQKVILAAEAAIKKEEEYDDDNRYRRLQ